MVIGDVGDVGGGAGARDTTDEVTPGWGRSCRIRRLGRSCRIRS